MHRGAPYEALFSFIMSSMDFVDPKVVVSQFHLRPGDRVGDLGSGVGHYLAPLSRVVGGSGKVFAVEIQKNLATAAADHVRKERLGNVEVIWGDLEHGNGAKLPDGTLDAALLSNTLSMAEDRQAVLRESRRLLRKGGKLLVVDWSDSYGGMGPAPAMVVSEEVARTESAEAGFTFERSFPAGTHHYGLAFRAS